MINFVLNNFFNILREGEIYEKKYNDFFECYFYIYDFTD